MSEITWGDSVRIATDADHERAGEIASACGFRSVSGRRIVLVEFGDGTAEEFAEDCLTLVGAV